MENCVTILTPLISALAELCFLTEPRNWGDNFQFLYIRTDGQSVNDHFNVPIFKCFFNHFCWFKM